MVGLNIYEALFQIQNVKLSLGRIRISSETNPTQFFSVGIGCMIKFKNHDNVMIREQKQRVPSRTKRNYSFLLYRFTVLQFFYYFYFDLFYVGEKLITGGRFNAG
jgi:hypothetical protein